MPSFASRALGYVILGPLPILDNPRREKAPLEGYATSREVAEYLKVKPQTLDAWASQDKGPPFSRAEGVRRYDWEELAAWLDQRKGGSPTFSRAPLLKCSACKKPVKSDGYLGISHLEVTRAKKEDMAYKAYVAEKKARLGDFAGGVIEDNEWDMMPNLACWFILHRACDPEPERNDYSYGIESVNTWPKFVSFVAHVGEKNWVQDHTDLSALLRRAIGE